MPMRHVALLVGTSGAYGRGLLRGIARFNRERKGWSTYFQPQGLNEPPPPWLKDWRGDGILATIRDRNMARLLTRLDLPVVNLRGALPDLPFPYVGLDQRQTAALAAGHLLERGLRSFAFCGRPRGIHRGFDARADSFIQRIRSAGYECAEFQAAQGKAEGSAWEAQQRRLAKWIKSLPKPVGIMATNDELGLEVLDACRRCDAAVPDEVALVGVDNDEHLCELAIPPMSSVDVNAEQVGYTAAGLLEDLMSGEKPPAEPILLAPRGVVTRLSTDVVATQDPAVNQAVTYIREHACDRIDAADVLGHVRLSRASLEPRMKRVLGRTIHQEIHRVRVERAKDLLAHSTMPIKQVAHEAGFSGVQYLTRVFRHATGETPAHYRRARA
jgi:LacI family transcriptional regulator